MNVPFGRQLGAFLTLLLALVVLAVARMTAAVRRTALMDGK
jgi:hypothetical protein